MSDAIDNLKKGYAESAKQTKERKIAPVSEQDEVTLNNPLRMIAKGFEAMTSDDESKGSEDGK
ncbi:hypothetical protein ACTWQL_13780 [Pseudalkalibacillus sp. R45]|uniref:hypothetical protein n=1 Tax=Pseudalkalibacillus sp. R45 TaxID=3457433 RepID=UPI003FCC689D